MPLPSAITRAIYDAAAKSTIDKHGQLNTLARAQQWIRDTGTTPADYGFGSKTALQNAVLNVVKVAKESVNLGAYITQTGYDVATLPRVPAGPEWTNDVRYRVLVGITDSAGLRRSTMINIYSDSTLNYSDIGTRAIEIAKQESGGPGKSPIPGFDDIISEGGTIDVYVMSAGRR